MFARVIHKGSSFSFAEAECCIGEAASEACWEPCYCVLLQDEQTLTAYRSEDMAVSRFYRKSLSDSPGFIRPSCSPFLPSTCSRKTRGGFTYIILDLLRVLCHIFLSCFNNAFCCRNCDFKYCKIVRLIKTRSSRS